VSALLSDLLIPLITVGLAELGDKTQLSLLILSSKTRNHSSLLLGVSSAFLLVDGVAIVAGSWVTQILPRLWLKAGSGIVFTILGILMLREIKAWKDGTGGGIKLGNAFLMGFSLIFLTEWGDKTQISSALLAAEYNPYMVLIGTMSALIALSMVTVYLGGRALTRIDRRSMMKISGIIFIIIGLYMVFI
jgi:putative Ca2+/H+ antiporter (TMEM165/GDT1 family)